MTYRRKAGQKKAEAFTRIGISLRNSEIKALDRVRVRLNTSRSGAIGTCITAVDKEPSE